MTTTDQPGAEVARVKPSDLVQRYAGSFSRLLPSHMREDGGGDQWVATVKALLLTRPEIAEAAANGPGEFLSALVQAARKGLEPGTPEFHLVPFAPKKGKPRVIQGIEGYQGIIERIYRAGAVSSVIVEVVRERDTFNYRPGLDARPEHVVDWFGERGRLLGAYAYAIMRDGSTSKVVVIGPEEAKRARAKSASAGSDYSPWNTDTAAMWAKTAARRLENWVPTSAEYRRQQLRDAQAVLEERNRSAGLAEQLDAEPIPAAVLDAAHDDDAEDAELVDPVTGEVLDEDPAVVDAVVVETPAGDGPAGDGGADAPGPGVVPVEASASPVIIDAAPDADEDVPDADSPAEVVPVDLPPLQRQTAAIRTECARLGIQAQAEAKAAALSAIVGRALDGRPPLFGLTRAEADGVLETLQGFTDADALAEFVAGVDALPEEGVDQ